MVKKNHNNHSKGKDRYRSNPRGGKRGEDGEPLPKPPFKGQFPSTEGKEKKKKRLMC